MEAPFKAQFTKTSMCPQFGKGCCQKSAKCRFAHYAYELKQRPNLTKTRLCEHFLDHGFCFDSECIFAHGLEELRVNPTFYKSKLCEEYKLGQCVYGARCNFSHGDEELQNNGEGRVTYNRTSCQEYVFPPNKANAASWQGSHHIEQMRMHGHGIRQVGRDGVHLQDEWKKAREQNFGPTVKLQLQHFLLDSGPTTGMMNAEASLSPQHHTAVFEANPSIETVDEGDMIIAQPIALAQRRGLMRTAEDKRPNVLMLDPWPPDMENCILFL